MFYGGARGGGKTDGVLGDFVSHADLYGEHAIGLMVRRERTQLIETIERSKTIYTPIGAKYHEQDKMWRFTNGARLRFAYLERDADADAYQGHSYSRIYVEEIGTFPNQAPIMKLMATLRSGAGIPCGFRATGNPGGPGHNWVKARYIDPAPGGWQVIKSEFENPWTKEKLTRERVYIPSKLIDNKYLGSDYVANLYMSGSEQLVKAWLEGDWNIIDGAFFDGWSSKNIIRPFAIPADWLRFRSGDWGFASPFSVGWWAVCPDDWWHEASQCLIPKGAIVRYREWYGCSGTPNVGLRLTAEEVAAGVVSREKGEAIAYGVLDPSAFARTSGPSIAERMLDENCLWKRADNTRVAQGKGAMGGWDAMRARIKGDGEYPALFVFDTCKDFIRTVPVLQHDPDKAEDLNTEQEDHAADECRYACVSRPYIPRTVEPPKQDKLIYTAQADGSVVANKSILEIVREKERKMKMDADV